MVVSGIKDDRTLSREDDKSVTEINFVNGGDEYESIVGWVFQPNNEKSIQLYPSPEFLNSLSFIKKFYPAPRWGEGELINVTHENSRNSRHSERIAKESSLLQYKAAAKNENNLTETNLFTHSPIHLFTLKRTATLAEGATHVAHCDKSRRTAFTLAEVLITLGIIGVVAALTIPSLITKYQKWATVNKLKATYTILCNAFEMAKNDYGLNINQWELPDGVDEKSSSDFFAEKYLIPYLKITKDCNPYVPRECLPHNVSKNRTFILSNGVIVSVAASHEYDLRVLIGLYINGYKNKNKAREEMFF